MGENEMKKLFGVFAVFLFFSVGFISGFQFERFMVLDSCLDAGGVWDAQKKSCVYSEAAALDLYIRLGQDEDHCLAQNGIWEEKFRYCKIPK